MKESEQCSLSQRLFNTVPMVLTIAKRQKEEEKRQIRRKREGGKDGRMKEGEERREGGRIKSIPFKKEE